MGNGRIGPVVGAARTQSLGLAGCLSGALVLSLLPFAALGDHSVDLTGDHSGDPLTEYRYTIIREGEAIGTHRVTVSPDGQGTLVEAKTDLEVTFGPLTLYEMQHLRQEIWRDGELEEMTAYTNKNGDIYDIAITRETQGYKRVVNGRTDSFDLSVRILALWHEDLFKYTSFLSPMEDRTYRISVDFVGADKIDLIDRSVDAFHYRISGDTNRELWYDDEGHIMKVRLLDHSSEIEYVLSEINGAPTKLARTEPAAAPAPHGPVTRLAARR